MPAYAGGVSFGWLDNLVFKRIEISGSRRLGFHSYNVSGDREAFDSVNVGGQGSRRFTNFGSLQIAGKNVLGILNFQAAVLDSRWRDPQAQRFSLNYDRKNLKLNYGDIQGALLNTNRFAFFNKTLKGIGGSYRIGRLSVAAVRSAAKGSARTVVIAGTNSSGPYFLQSSQVIDGSEQVQVDGQILKLGIDYVVNYELGSITFLNRIVAPTSSIVVTYEALGFNASQGTVQGAGMTYELGKLGRLGFTALSQSDRGSTGLATREEKFQGFGAPGTPYILQFEPLKGRPIVVRVDGVLQIENVDYFFDPANAAILYFRRFVPATSEVSVFYTPRPTATVDGDRDVIGFDYRLGFGKSGKNGSLSLYQATGRLKSDVNPMRGTARGADLIYTDKNLEFRTGIRNVPREFVSVETVGFNRNERAQDISLTLKGPRNLRYGLTHGNSSVSSRIAQTDGAIRFDASRFTTATLFVNQFTEAGSEGWSFEQKRIRSSVASRGTQIDSSALTFDKRLSAKESKWGSLNLRLGLDRQNGFGAAPNGARTPFALNTARVGLGYRLRDAFTLEGNASLSAVDASGKKGVGRDIGASATYRPFSRLTLGASYQLSDSGALATLGGISNGYGLGYGGNGFSGGSSGDAILGASDLQTSALTAEYRPTERVALNAFLRKTRTSGSVTSNSDSSSMGFGGALDFGRNTNLSLTLDRTATRFIGSTALSNATTFDMFLSSAPSGRLNLRAGVSLLLNSGNSEFRQNAFTYEGSLTYRLAPRHALNGTFYLGRTQGYYPQDDRELALTYQYQLYRDLGLNVRYAFRNVRNLEQNLNTGAYRSRGFDVELSFNFGGF